MQNKKIYFDTETTGTHPVKNDIIQIAGVIEIDGQEKERFNFTCQPFSWENIDQEALDVHGMDEEKLKTFKKPGEVYQELKTIFTGHVNPYDRDDKFIVCGYNVKFDIDFLSEFFKKNGNNYLFSFFGTVKDPLPILNYLKSIGKIDSENLKLFQACEFFGIDIKNAHDALADIEATKAIIEKTDELMNQIKI